MTGIRSIGASLGLKKNELIEPVIHKSATEPGGGSGGQVYYNTSPKEPYYYNGVEWVKIGAAPFPWETVTINQGEDGEGWPFGFRYETFSSVRFRGTIKPTSAWGSEHSICTLPEGYRPSKRVFLSLIAELSVAKTLVNCLIRVGTSGSIILLSPASLATEALLCFDGAEFTFA